MVKEEISRRAAFGRGGGRRFAPLWGAFGAPCSPGFQELPLYKVKWANWGKDSGF